MHEAAPVKIRILSDEISYLNFNLKVLSNTELELTIDENKSTSQIWEFCENWEQ